MQGRNLARQRGSSAILDADKVMKHRDGILPAGAQCVATAAATAAAALLRPCC